MFQKYHVLYSNYRKEFFSYSDEIKKNFLLFMFSFHFNLQENREHRRKKKEFRILDVWKAIQN